MFLFFVLPITPKRNNTIRKPDPFGGHLVNYETVKGPCLCSFCSIEQTHASRPCAL